MLWSGGRESKPICLNKLTKLQRTACIVFQDYSPCSTGSSHWPHSSSIMERPAICERPELLTSEFATLVTLPIWISVRTLYRITSSTWEQIQWYRDIHLQRNLQWHIPIAVNGKSEIFSLSVRNLSGIQTDPKLALALGEVYLGVKPDWIWSGCLRHCLPGRGICHNGSYMWKYCKGLQW